MENKKDDGWEDFGPVEKLDVDEVSIIAIILAIFFPPLGVLLKAGIGPDLIINIILTLFFWIPGVLHAFWVILRR